MNNAARRQLTHRTMSQPVYTIDPHFTVLEDGVTSLTLGLFATLYTQDVHTTEKREAVLKCLAHYIAVAGEHIKHFANPITQRLEPFTSTTPSYIRDYLLHQGNNAVAQQFDLRGGTTADDVSAFAVDFLGRPEWKKQQHKPGFFNIKLPYDWYAKRNDTFPDFFYQLCEILQPLHGYAGLGIILPDWDMVRLQNMEELVYHVAYPAPWLEVDYPVWHARDLSDGIKSISWLNALADVWVDKLGGADALREKLGPKFTVRNYPGGLTIQAGSEPNPDGPSIYKPLAEQIEQGVEPRFQGDIPEDREARRWTYLTAMPLHRKLAKILKPIRSQNIDAFHGGGWEEPEHYFDQAETQKWLNRFDE